MSNVLWWQTLCPHTRVVMEVRFYTISVVGGGFFFFFWMYRYLILSNTWSYSERHSLSQSRVREIPNSQLQLSGSEEGFKKLGRLTGGQALSKIILTFFKSAHICSGGKAEMWFLEVKGNTSLLLEVQWLVLPETLQWWHPHAKILQGATRKIQTVGETFSCPCVALLQPLALPRAQRGCRGVNREAARKQLTQQHHFQLITPRSFVWEDNVAQISSVVFWFPCAWSSCNVKSSETLSY